MDESLEKALEFSNYSVTFNNQKRLLQEKYQEDLLLYTLGGKFAVSKELISFCWVLKNTTNNTVIVDENSTPIQIDDLDSFLTDAIARYTEATNQYLSDYKKLSTERSVEGLIDV
jgi:hypothetical protein